MGKIFRFPMLDPASLEQMCIIDHFEKMIQTFALAEGQESADAEDGSDTKSAEADSYLLKGERLVSLAKEKFKKVLGGLEFSSFEEMLYGVKVKKDGYIEAISKLMRLILRREEVDSPTIRGILSFIQFDVSLTKVERSDSAHWYYHALPQSVKPDELLLLTINEQGFMPLKVYGLKNHTHPGRWKNVLFKNSDCCADIAQILSVLICCTIIKNILKDPFSESYMAMKEACKERVCYASSVIGSRYKASEGEFNFGGLFKHPFWVDPKPATRLYADELERYLSSKGVTIQYVERAGDVRRARQLEGYDYPVIITRDTKYLLLEYDPWGMLTYNGLIFHDFLESKEGRYWANPMWGRKYLLEQACESYFKQKQEQVKAYTGLKNLAESYARSFEDKKNIPKKTLKAMEGSKLNEYFGFVEYDEDVDLVKVAQVVEEFIGFKEKYLPMIESGRNAIRFRKLGNHKAIGLYYPIVRCLCVDYRHVHSFIHEYGHLIDYEYGNLSLKGDFTRIKTLYEQALKRAMREDESFRTRMGKGKYNLDYYLTPTEIFARTFELYFSKVLNVQTSLVPETFGPEYPMNEEFLNEVKDYFDAKLLVLSATEESDMIEDVAASR